MTTTTVEHHVLRLRPGQLLKESIVAYLAQQNIDAGWVVTCVGSLTVYHLRFANQETGKFGSGHFEILSLSGALSQSGVHLHLSVADAAGVAVGGHLLDGCRVYTTVELVLGVARELRFEREVDNIYGYRELVVRAAKIVTD